MTTAMKYINMYIMNRRTQLNLIQKEWAGICKTRVVNQVVRDCSGFYILIKFIFPTTTTV